LSAASAAADFTVAVASASMMPTKRVGATGTLKRTWRFIAAPGKTWERPHTLAQGARAENNNIMRRASDGCTGVFGNMLLS
jgi:hypothetical protein